MRREPDRQRKPIDAMIRPGMSTINIHPHVSIASDVPARRRRCTLTIERDRGPEHMPGMTVMK